MAQVEHIFSKATGLWVGQVSLGTSKAHPKGEGDKTRFSMIIGRELLQVETHEAVPSLGSDGKPDYTAPMGSKVKLTWANAPAVLNG